MNCENCNNQIGNEVKFCGKCGLKIEIKQEEKPRLDETKKSSSNLTKEGLREIVTRKPFVPLVPINRKEFFIGLITIALAGFIVSFAASILFGQSILLTLIVTIIISYVSATWWTKRFLDIKPVANVKSIQITLFILLVTLNIITYTQAKIATNFNSQLEYILNQDSTTPEIDLKVDPLLMPISIARGAIGISLAIFMLMLVLKKGNKTKSMELRKN